MINTTKEITALFFSKGDRVLFSKEALTSKTNLRLYGGREFIIKRVKNSHNGNVHQILCILTKSGLMCFPGVFFKLIKKGSKKNKINKTNKRKH